VGDDFFSVSGGKNSWNFHSQEKAEFWKEKILYEDL